MKLITKEIEQKLEAYPLNSQGGKGKDAEIIVKYFNPFGAGTWLITEGEKQEDGSWLLFGYCHIFEWEWGYVALNELQDIGYIERDLYLDEGITVAEYLRDF